MRWEAFKTSETGQDIQVEGFQWYDKHQILGCSKAWKKGINQDWELLFRLFTFTRDILANQI